MVMLILAHFNVFILKLHQKSLLSSFVAICHFRREQMHLVDNDSYDLNTLFRSNYGHNYIVFNLGSS